MARVEDMLTKMMRRFDASHEHTNELRSDLASIGKKVDAHAILIKHLELQMDQLFSIGNPRQPGTFSSNTYQNTKNNGHCMEVTNRDGKQNTDAPMPSCVENVIIGHNEVLEVSGN